MKKWIKILGLVTIVPGLFWLLGYGLKTASQHSYFDRPHIGHIGYLDPSYPDASENFKRCNDKLPIGFFHSSAPAIYKGGKPAFSNYILSNFSKNTYNDNGFLNLRFLINCKGKIGDIEINELNTDYEISSLNSELVNELSKLTFRKENWNSIETLDKRDTYMYIIYKIENGEITEILP